MKPYEADLTRPVAPVPRAGRLLLALLSRLRYGSLRVNTPDGVSFFFEGELPGPSASFDVIDWRACGELLRRGDVGFAEGYIERLWDTEDLAGLITLAAMNRAGVERAVYGHWWGQVLYRLRHFLRANTRTGSRRNIAAHYDLGNEFYRLWLDDTMTYSAGIFGDDATCSLEAAQFAKYKRVLERLGARRGERILEIGCGWEGSRRTRRRHGAATWSALPCRRNSLNGPRAGRRREGFEHRARFQLLDYRDTVGIYDYVVSLEMYEAVGERYWPVYFRTLRERRSQAAKR